MEKWKQNLYEGVEGKEISYNNVLMSVFKMKNKQDTGK